LFQKPRNRFHYIQNPFPTFIFFLKMSSVANGVQTSRLIPLGDFEINGRKIGPGYPAYIIAELSCNHLGSLEKAKEILRAAAKTGADAFKLQTYTGDTITLNCQNEHFLLKDGTQWDGKYLWDLFEGAHTPWAWHKELFDLAKELGMDAFSSPFDETAVDFLEELDVPVYKVASMECVDIPLLKKVAATKKPVIMSTGMASLADIEEAVRTLRAHGTTQIALLKCTSAYPSKPEDVNLVTMQALSTLFNVPVGLSDHTLTTTIPVAAAALGGCIVEKHFTLRRSDGGPDATFSLEPEEFKAMVDGVRTTQKALGHVHFGGTKGEVRRFRRSIFSLVDIKKGERLTAKNIRSIRPGNGLHSRNMDTLLDGFVARVDIKKGTPMAWDIVEKSD